MGRGFAWFGCRIVRSRDKNHETFPLGVYDPFHATLFPFYFLTLSYSMSDVSDRLWFLATFRWLDGAIKRMSLAQLIGFYRPLVPCLCWSWTAYHFRKRRPLRPMMTSIKLQKREIKQKSDQYEIKWQGWGKRTGEKQKNWIGTGIHPTSTPCTQLVIIYPTTWNDKISVAGTQLCDLLLALHNRYPISCNRLISRYIIEDLIQREDNVLHIALQIVHLRQTIAAVMPMKGSC